MPLLTIFLFPEAMKSLFSSSSSDGIRVLESDVALRRPSAGGLVFLNTSPPLLIFLSSVRALIRPRCPFECTRAFNAHIDDAHCLVGFCRHI